MLIGPPDFRRTYDEIRNSSLTHSTCRVVIFVSCLDIDALCAAKVLANTFKTDLIPHRLVPIVGYEEMKSTYAELDDDVANVICIGCGATVDLESYLEITPLEADDEEVSPALVPNRKIHVIDNHRPWNLDNLFGSQNVICWDDGAAPTELTEHEQAYMFLVNDSDSEDEDGDDDSDHGEHEIDDEIDLERDIDGAGDTDDDEVGGVVTNGRVSGANGVDTERENLKRVKRERRAFREKHTGLLEDYYAQGTFVRSSSTTQVYSLLSVIGETTPMNLWLTIVGVTSLDAQFPQVYAALYPLLKDEVQRLTHGNSGPDDSTLFIETDYSLFLLRHWSLYESMLHSSYLSAKLNLWTDDGRKKLHKMLAKMGIALHESKEQWTHMAIPLKRSLKDKLSTVSDVYGIEEIIRKGIVRRYGFKGSVSAGDAVDAVAALLAATFNIPDRQTAYPTPPHDGNEGLEKFWVTSFWSGWDALDNFELLMEGVSRAKALQQAIVATSTVLFEKRQIKDLRLFRLAVIKDGPDLHVFRNPLALTRLGVWIAEGCAEAHLPPLPLVVAAFDLENNTYVVLGMGPRKPRDSSTSFADVSEVNKFGTAFQRTATRLNARVRIDGFESSVIQVAKDDLSRFLEALTISGLVA